MFYKPFPGVIFVGLALFGLILTMILKIKNPPVAEVEDGFSVEDRLIEIKGLYEKGLINDAEYNKIRQEIISGI